ncbi:hypothetical protein ACSFB8_05360 [Enterococcus faecalis]
MEDERKVTFIWDKICYSGLIEKEYENSYLVVVTNPSPDMEEKYTTRMVISKKVCEPA